ncbi:MacB family efflux pump subunit [Paraburkholderia sp. NMBU_R16]|uniref:MacB family efflux pump subunit n=1 Tax=Paraburkholderia sp. NMBU_R16 TaxID=2698676 RepID=UPI0015644886|nr:MacB family efflux pump subunit [Paraburkholderia sp. NMBU_R16]NRO96062.1 MacB family efflux pump subunit [Paraburkholderia sp. NMBU_R16]
MSTPLLQLIDVARRFPTGERDVVVLKNINLSIDTGEIVAIVGASGSGKSTLMNILGGLDQPSAGIYRVAGVDTRELDADALARLRRERFGFIFQRYHLLPHLSAAANVEMPAVYAGSPPAARRARAEYLLARLGLAQRTGHRPGQLSGGQQQRVSIARALMNGGEIILADEPTGALDSASGQDVIRILSELNALGHTVVIVTHDEHVAAHAHRIIEMRDGEIVADRANTPVLDDVRQAVADVDAPAACTVQSSAASGVSAPPRQRASRCSARIGRFAEAFKMAWLALVSRRLRTILTMLGIIIGITSVVSIVAIGEGAKRYMLDEIASIGTNTISIYPGRDWGDSQASMIETLVPRDLSALAEQAYIDSVTPETSRSLLLRYRNIDVHALVSGVSEDYFRVRGMTFTRGVGFRAEDIRRQAPVAVIDQNTRRKLFGEHGTALGEVILVDNLPCVVIGVTAPPKSTFGDVKSLNVWLPYTTASGRLFGQRHFDSITVKVRDDQPAAVAESSLAKLLTQRHGRKDFFTYNVDDVVKTLERTGRALTLLLSLIAVISLVVGGIGVMNIMLVSVTERTREIGIRMAVGARQSDIMQQFLVEAVTVCLMGGAIGIALSFGIGSIFSLIVDEWKMVFAPAAIVIAFLCSTLTGVVFGFMPARNAARLDPIDALARD